jgi:fructokinase
MGGAGRTLVLGECLVDLAPTSAGAPGGVVPGAGKAGPWAGHFVAMPGGGPANIAVALARLGAPASFAGRFSRRGLGPWLRSYLAANGLDLALSVDADEDATIALVTFDDEGRASYTFYGPGTADWQWQKSELPDLSVPPAGDRGIGAVHTGSLALALDPGASVLATWLSGLRRDGRVLVSFDPNVRPSFVKNLSAYRKLVAEVVSRSHIVKASTEDIEVLDPGAGSAVGAERWLSEGVSLVVITDGPSGATAFHRNGARAHSTPPAIEVVDTIGAGDTFSAALLSYFWEHGFLEPEAIDAVNEAHLLRATAQAVAASALTCTRPGADPPTKQELASFMAERA